jgi:hypothetical protein
MERGLILQVIERGPIPQVIERGLIPHIRGDQSSSDREENQFLK